MTRNNFSRCCFQLEGYSSNSRVVSKHFVMPSLQVFPPQTTERQEHRYILSGAEQTRPAPQHPYQGNPATVPFGHLLPPPGSPSVTGGRVSRFPSKPFCSGLFEAFLNLLNVGMPITTCFSVPTEAVAFFLPRNNSQKQLPSLWAPASKKTYDLPKNYLICGGKKVHN